MFHPKKFSTPISKLKRFAIVLSSFMILSTLGLIAASARNNTATSVYLPLVLDKYDAWSTNFADVTDLNAAGIHEQNELSHTSDAHLSIDTTNVNSGGKSIRDSGMLVNPTDNFTINFYISKLTGQDSIDLSNKMLSIEMYLPEDPGFSLLHIALSSSGAQWFTINVRAGIFPQKGRWYTYKVDLEMVLALGSWQFFDYLHSPEISTTADALSLLQNVQYIQVYAEYPYGDGEKYLLIDRLGWEPSGPPPAYDPEVESLRKYAAQRNMPIGSTVDLNSSSDPDFMGIVLQQFSFGEAFNIDWPATEPANDDFSAAVQVPQNVFMDQVSQRLGMGMVRYMIYPAFGSTGIPDWLRTKNYTDTQTSLENFADALSLSHKGNTKIWLVFNELLRYDLGCPGCGPYTGLGLKDRNQGPPYTWANEYSPFSNSPSDVTMIKAAFEAAHKADPDALLFLTDGSASEMGHTKPEAFYNLVDKLVSEGTPIDGIAFQGHYLVDQNGLPTELGDESPLAYNPTDGLTGISQNIERYEALGLKFAFGEVDVPIYIADADSSPAGQLRLAERRQIQAELYRNLMHIALTHPNVVTFNFLSWADQYSWIGRDLTQLDKSGVYGEPGIYDVNWQPKLAYYALLDELKGSTLPGPFLKALPLDGAEGQSTYPTLKWTKYWGAASYEYCIDTSDNDSCDTSWISTGTDTYASLSGLSAGTTYSWQVRARNAAGVTLADRGPWRSFTPLYGPNLALGHPVTASSCEDDPCIYPAGYAVDGDYSTRWSSAFADPQWFQVDLGGTYDIQHVNLHWATFAYATAYQIQISDNATDWTTIHSTTTGDGSLDSLNVTGNGRYVRIYGTARAYPWGYSLNELEVYETHP